MKEKIDGHTFDTDTAKKIGDWLEGEDDEGWRESIAIYKTRSGQWFMHIQVDGPSRGEEIVPLPEAEAIEELRKHTNWLDEEQKKRLAKALIGSIGGAKKTAKKAAASRENGKKGGRPKKKREAPEEANHKQNHH